MSKQLTISSLFSTLALVVLVLFARAGDIAHEQRSDGLVQTMVSATFDG